METQHSWTTRIPTKYKKYNKIKVKADISTWINTHDPVIVPFSIHSLFHVRETGALKVKAFMTALKQNIQGPITILLAEKAHLHTLSLMYNHDQEKAFAKAKQDAIAIVTQFNADFQGCNVVFWDDFISNDPHYALCAHKIIDLYNNNTHFKKLIIEDAESTYSKSRAQEFPNKQLYVSSAINDILEHCIYTLVIANYGYRFQFYPGNKYPSSHFANITLLPPEKQIAHINLSFSFQ